MFSLTREFAFSRSLNKVLCSALVMALLSGSSAWAEEVDAKPLDTSLDEFPAAIKKMESAKGKDAFALAQEMNKHTRDRYVRTDVYEQALDAMRRVLPASDPAIPFAVYNLALVKHGREETKALLQQAVDTERQYRPDSLKLADYLETLCSFVARSEACKIVPEIYSIRKKQAPNDFELAEKTVYDVINYPPDKELMLKVGTEFLAIAEKSPGKNDERLARALDLLVLCNEGDAAAQIPYLERLAPIDIARGAYGRAYRKLAQCYVSQKKYMEAIDVYELLLGAHRHHPKDKSELLIAVAETSVLNGNNELAAYKFGEALSADPSDENIRTCQEFLAKAGNSKECQELKERLQQFEASQAARKERETQGVVSEDKLKMLSPQLSQLYLSTKGFSALNGYWHSIDADRNNVLSKTELASRIETMRKNGDGAVEIASLDAVVKCIDSKGKTSLTRKDVADLSTKTTEDLVVLAASSVPLDSAIKSVIVETLSGMCYGGKSPSQFAERVNSLLKQSKPGFSIAITEPTEQRGMFGRTFLRMVTVTGPDESMWIGELQYGDGSKAGVGEALGR